MPIFGKSLFETVLDGLDADDVDEEEEIQPARRMTGAGATFLAGLPGESGVDQGDFAGLYSDFAETPPVPGDVAPPARPLWLLRLLPGEIEDDLGLTPGLTEAELRERRRIFARANHPDMMHLDFREPATIRMTVANRLIDDAIAALGRQV